jgi:hypothetical protein
MPFHVVKEVFGSSECYTDLVPLPAEMELGNDRPDVEQENSLKFLALLV